MKNLKLVVLSVALLATIIVVSAFNTKTSSPIEKQTSEIEIEEQQQLINLFVTHGHCSLPFAGIVKNLQIVTSNSSDQGNSLENMKVSFEIDPHTFNACRGEDLTDRIKTPGLFITENKDNITFRSTNVYTMGIDWYQINGKLSIRGEERDVKFFASGIREPEATMATSLIIEGQMDLSDWGIDYDRIVSGTSSEAPTKWMHLNMKIDLSPSNCTYTSENLIKKIGLDAYSSVNKDEC